MSDVVGVTIRHDDGSTLDVPITDLAAAVAALRTTQSGGSRGSRPTGYEYDNSDTCPVHEIAWTIKEGGSNPERGTSWDAFWKCDGKVDGNWCNHRPSRDWVDTHPASRNDASQVAPEPPQRAVTNDPDFDDLPW